MPGHNLYSIQHNSAQFNNIRDRTDRSCKKVLKTSKNWTQIYCYLHAFINSRISTDSLFVSS